MLFYIYITIVPVQYNHIYIILIPTPSYKQKKLIVKPTLGGWSRLVRRRLQQIIIIPMGT